MKAEDWKEVNKEMPQINTLCLVCRGFQIPKLMEWDGESWCDDIHYYRRSYFTYWMPIVMPWENKKED